MGVGDAVCGDAYVINHISHWRTPVNPFRPVFELEKKVCLKLNCRFSHGGEPIVDGYQTGLHKALYCGQSHRICCTIGSCMNLWMQTIEAFMSDPNLSMMES